MIAEPFIDLARHARTIESLIEMSTKPLSKDIYANVQKVGRYEREALAEIADAAASNPTAFGDNATDISQGVAKLRAAVDGLESVTSLPPSKLRAKDAKDTVLAEPTGSAARILGMFMKYPTYSAQSAGKGLTAAHQDVIDAHMLLGGTRNLPGFEAAPAGFKGPDIPVAPLDDPHVVAKGWEKRQTIGLKVIRPVLNLAFGGIRSHGPEVPKTGPVFLAASHVASYDALVQSAGVGRPVRAMFDGRFRTSADGKPTMLGKVMEGLGGYGVTKGDGKGGADGMRVFTGALKAGQASVVYPQGLVYPAGAPTQLADSTIKAVMQLNSGITDPAKKIPIQVVTGHGYQESKFLKRAGRNGVDIVRDAPKVYDAPPTEANVKLAVEDVARRMDQAMQDAVAFGEAHRAAANPYRGATAGAGAAILGIGTYGIATSDR